MSDWQILAKQKKDSVDSLIPKSWLLPHAIPSPEEQRDVTGDYIRQFLSPKEVEITETDAVGIVKNTTAGIWSAREVTGAFCHRAALAHQLVSPKTKGLRAVAHEYTGQLSSRSFLRGCACRSTEAR